MADEGMQLRIGITVFDCFAICYICSFILLSYAVVGSIDS